MSEAAIGSLLAYFVLNVLFCKSRAKVYSKFKDQEFFDRRKSNCALYAGPDRRGQYSRIDGKKAA